MGLFRAMEFADSATDFVELVTRLNCSDTMRTAILEVGASYTPLVEKFAQLIGEEPATLRASLEEKFDRRLIVGGEGAVERAAAMIVAYYTSRELRPPSPARAPTPLNARDHEYFFRYLWASYWSAVVALVFLACVFVVVKVGTADGSVALAFFESISFVALFNFILLSYQNERTAHAQGWRDPGYPPPWEYCKRR